MTKRQILFLLTLTLCFSTLIKPITLIQASSDNLTSSDLGFYTNYFSVTSSNASQALSDQILIGYAYGSGQPYTVVALLHGSFQVEIIFTRVSEGSYILLTPLKNVWQGNISFYDCCGFEPLYVQLQFSPNFISNQSTILFTLYYSIYSHLSSPQSFVTIFSLNHIS